MCNTIPEDEDGMPKDINGPENNLAVRMTIGHLVDKVETLEARIKELEDGIRWIAEDKAFLQSECTFTQCEMYVKIANELLRKK